MSSCYCASSAVPSGPDYEPFDSPAFNCTEEENDAALKTIRRRAWTTLLNKIKEHTADAALLAKLRASFEELFRYDEHGVPRVWKPEDDLDGVFKKAKDVVSTAIPLSQPNAHFLVDPRPHFSLRKDRPYRSFSPPRQYHLRRRPPAIFPGLQLGRRIRLCRLAGPPLRDQAAGHNLPVPTRRRCLLRRGQTFDRCQYRSDPVLDVRCVGGTGMERGHDGSFQSTLFRRAPWIVGCRVSTTLAVPLDALLTSSARFAIIQLNLAGPLFAVTRTVTGEVR